MSLSYYRYIDNWHKHPWISKILCKIGRHDYNFMWMDGKNAILECFYCEHRRSSRTCLGFCDHCGEELGKNWRCYNEQCREERREIIQKSIEEAEKSGLYDVAEHFSGSGAWLGDKK